MIRPKLKNVIKWIPFAIALSLFMFVMYFFSKDLRRIINTFVKVVALKGVHGLE
jgi:hypothetical protein